MSLTKCLAPAAAAVVALVSGTAAADQGSVERGKYLAAIMDCGGCHTRGIFFGKPDPALFLAGSEVGFRIPGLGYFYPPNLTPDEETGLGSWSEAQIVDAVRAGVRPDGRQLVPVMPYHSYSALSDDDAYALAAYLKSLAPVSYPDEPPPTGDAETAPGPYLDVRMP